MRPRLVFITLLSIYSLVGILYLQWNIFYFVYLYWAENVIGLLAYFVRMYATPHLADMQGKAITRKQARGGLGTGLFANFVFFVFIIVGVGILHPVFAMDKDKAIQFIKEMVMIVGFKNTSFNMALWTCLLFRVGETIRDFWQKNAYSPQKPLEVPSAFSKQDLVLHITILFGLGGATFLQNPEFGGRLGLGAQGWAQYSVGVVMIAMRLILEWVQGAKKP